MAPNTQSRRKAPLAQTGPATAPVIDRLLTEQETAEILRWDPKTLQRRRWLGLGPPFVRIGERTIRYRARDILEFIRDGGDDVSAA